MFDNYLLYSGLAVENPLDDIVRKAEEYINIFIFNMNSVFFNIYNNLFILNKSNVNIKNKIILFQY